MTDAMRQRDDCPPTFVEPQLHPVADWLLRHAVHGLEAEQLLAHLNERLGRCGVPVWRSSLNVHTLHPEVFVRNVVWSREAGAVSELVSHIDRASATYKNSPVSLIYEGSGPIRRRLDNDRDSHYFPICKTLADQGGTDYIILPLRFSNGERTFVSFATDAPAGFSAENLQTLYEITPFLALRIELESSYFATTSLLQLYLGRNAARRVLDGAFKRGEGQALHAAIWYCDLRDFTTFSDRHDPADVVAMLDNYFEKAADAVRERGGEVLKFIGDALLAVFDFAQTDPWTACNQALAAGVDAIAHLEDSHADHPWGDSGAIRMGVSLHVGNVLYGNIGSLDRLDFTVIGSAVNEACRLEALCRVLGVPLVMSRQFADMCSDAEPICLGKHELKGVAGAKEVFTVEQLGEGRFVLGNPPGSRP